jgi:hypothetical protein
MDAMAWHDIFGDVAIMQMGIMGYGGSTVAQG